MQLQVVAVWHTFCMYKVFMIIVYDFSKFISLQIYVENDKVKHRQAPQKSIR